MVDQVYEILKNSNVKLTPCREEILHILYDNRGNHLDIVSIHTLAKATEHNRIGVATVYRTLELLENIGLVSRITMDESAARYELTIHNKLDHHHLICLKCGIVQDISDEIAGEFKIRIDKAMAFEVTNKPMKIYGYCRKCRSDAQSNPRV